MTVPIVRRQRCGRECGRSERHRSRSINDRRGGNHFAFTVSARFRGTVTYPTASPYGFAQNRMRPHQSREKLPDTNRTKAWLDPVRLQESGIFPRAELTAHRTRRSRALAGSRRGHPRDHPFPRISRASQRVVRASPSASETCGRQPRTAAAFSVEISLRAVAISMNP